MNSSGVPRFQCWWWKLLKILFPATQWIICGWILRGEGIHIQWDEGQIMKVIYLKKQAKNSRFYSLVSFTRPHEKPWKRKHSSNSPTFLHLRMRPKAHRLGEENNFFYMLWQYKLDKNFYLTFEKNWSLLSSMTAKICFKILMKSLVDHFSQQSFESEIDKLWSGFEYHRNGPAVQHYALFLSWPSMACIWNSGIHLYQSSFEYTAGRLLGEIQPVWAAPSLQEQSIELYS